MIRDNNKNQEKRIEKPNPVKKSNKFAAIEKTVLSRRDTSEKYNGLSI